MNPALRANRISPASSCHECAFLDVCGGWDDEKREQGCFQRCERCYDEPCDCVCPNNLIWMDRAFEDVQGICTPPREMHLPQFGSEALPTYLPQIYHGGKRSRRLMEPWVSIPLHYVSRHRKNGQMDLLFESGEELRRKMGLSQNTKIILSSVCPDHYIEAFWASWRSRGLLEIISRWGLSGMTTPNYSITLDTPRINALWNISRIFRMIDWISEHGIPVISHINASTRSDWRKWTEVLRSFPGVRFVSTEFQTGLGNSHDGHAARDRYIGNLSELQESCGGRIHPIVHGGAGSIPQLASIFPTFTIVDATPFLKTEHRFRLEDTHYRMRWRFVSTAPTEDLSERLAHNIAAQRAWLYEKNGLTPNGRTVQPEFSSVG
jgi:hypothetical protein